MTCPFVDMNFIFECSTQYVTSERSERVRYRVEQEKIKFISTSGHVMFCLLYKHTNDDFFDVFPKISDQFRRFPKILEKLPEGQTIVSVHFPKIVEDYRRLPKIPEDFRGRTDAVSIIE